MNQQKKVLFLWLGLTSWGATVAHSVFILLLLHISVSGKAQKINNILNDNSVQRICKWRIVGPFNDKIQNSHQLDSLKRVARQNGAQIKDTICFQNINRIDLEKLLSTRNKAIAYGSCTVFSEKDQDIIFFITVDDKLKIWVNDDSALIIKKHTTQGLVPKKSKLKKGRNHILVEIENNGRDWWFDIGILGDKGTQQVLMSMKNPPPTNVISDKYEPRTQLAKWRIIGPVRNTIDAIEDFDLIKATSYISRQPIVDTLYQQGKPGNSLYSLFKTKEVNRIAYAICNVYSDKDQDVILDLRVDDELRLWINEKEILKSPADRIAIKKVSFRKGNNSVIAEVKNEYLDWWFEIAVSGIDYVRENMILPGYCFSSLNPIMSKGDSLGIGVADTNFIPVTRISKLEIFDSHNNVIYYNNINLRQNEKLCMKNLKFGAYKYNLYTDKDTLSEYFCYGPLDSIYNKDRLINKVKKNSNAYNSLLPYIGRFDRLITDYQKSSSTLLGKKLAYCLYKIKEIEDATSKKSNSYLYGSGLNLKAFISSIDHGQEHYLIYVPERMQKLNKAMPLVVMVPFVTNNHPFYTGTIIANYERISYISKFADRFGFAVIFPSSRIFKWYNQTPITTKAIVESIENAAKYYQFDKKRIFLYGECSGALFALQTAIRKPDLFAAIALRGPELSTVNLEDPGPSAVTSNSLFSLLDNLHGKSILAMHSNLDHAARIDFTNTLMDSLNRNETLVYYNNVPGLIKDYDMTSYSEPEVLNTTFSFFNNVNPTSLVKKFATHGFYNDTLYGIFIKEKNAPGKATVSYKNTNSKLELTTSNVAVLNLDIDKLNIKSLSRHRIYINGKVCSNNVDYKIKGNIIELYTESYNQEKKNNVREVAGPLNKVFLRTFAVVKPEKESMKSKSIICALDSLWITEYKNHILIIDKTQVDSVKKIGFNLVFIIDSLEQLPKPVLAGANIELKTNSLSIYSEEFFNPQFSFAFYYNDEHNLDNMFIGSGDDTISHDMLQSVFLRDGWYDFEIWDNNMPFFQKTYK
ncbi:PHB depolymerase family esterase [Niabella sp. 22666]|uniref:PHB depolymerase family esterase n=1 Tax=Niabella sp. 22666 TaxID=3453954 RepID=UPI003F86BA0E